MLRRVTLDVPRGAAFALVGENGAGKTTLMKCLLDFCDFEGSIRLRGVPSTQPEARACLAYLPERFNAPWFLTGRAFIRTMLAFGRRPWNETEVRELLKQLDLAPEALERPVRDFSKGMNQKLGLAACFLSQREILVMDEPMTGLDPSARFLVKRLLSGVSQQGKTLFFTSHSLADVEEICDHMAVLHKGGLAYKGAPAGLRERYGESSLERAFLKCIQEGSHV